MNWSTKIATVSGIDIKLHVTFPLILLLGALQWGGAHGPAGAAFGALLMAVLFVCVTLHELGHSLVAQAFRIPVREIVLLPLGGVALLGRMPEKPRQELAIAAAGPAVNVVLAAAIYVVTGATIGWEGLDGKGLVAGTRAEPSLGTLLVWLMEANISLVLFNLIPAFPLDGGRMLRAGLAMVTDYQRATRIAAGTGQLLAVGLGVLGVVGGNFLLVLVAVFVFFGAGMESFQTASRTVLTTLRVGDAYNKHALTLAPADRASKVVDYLLTSYQPDFGVVQAGRLLGVVTREDVLKALSAQDDDPYVTGIMRREVDRVEPGAGLDEVHQLMSEKSTRLVAVHEGERFLGLVSAEDIAEALAVAAVLQRRRRLRPALAG